MKPIRFHLTLLLLLAISVPSLLIARPSLAKKETSAALSLSTGPRSDSERLLLWQQAREFVDARDWRRADAALERLLFRYPEHPQRLEAQLLRAGALIELEKHDAAIPLLRETWQAGEKAPQWALPAGELLGRAWLQGGRLTEAVLLSQELRHRSAPRAGSDPSQARLARRTRAAAWRIEAHARLARLRLARVEGILRTMAEEDSRSPRSETPAGFSAEADWLALSVKRQRCREVFDRRFGSEAALLRGIEQTLLCERELLAATIREFEPPTAAAATPATAVEEMPAPLPFAFPASEQWVKRTLEAARAHLDEVARFCRAPRVAPPAEARTSEEKQRFLAELKDEVVERCRKEKTGLLHLVSAPAPLAGRLRGIVEETFSSAPAPAGSPAVILPSSDPGARHP